MCETYIGNTKCPVPANWIVVSSGRLREGDRYIQLDRFDGSRVWIQADANVQAWAGSFDCVIRRDEDPAPSLAAETLKHLLVAADMLSEIGLDAEAEYLRRRYVRRSADGPDCDPS